MLVPTTTTTIIVLVNAQHLVEFMLIIIIIIVIAAAVIINSQSMFFLLLVVVVVVVVVVVLVIPGLRIGKRIAASLSSLRFCSSFFLFLFCLCLDFHNAQTGDMFNAVNGHINGSSLFQIGLSHKPNSSIVGCF